MLVPRLLTGFARSLNLFESLGEIGYAFQGLESLRNLSGVWKFVDFVVFRALGKNCQLTSQQLPFPRPNSSLKITKNALPISFDWQSASVIDYSKGCAPLPDVRKSCVPSCCFSMPYLKGLWKVFEFWKDFSGRTLSDKLVLVGR